MNVKYIIDFSEGGDTYGLSKILKGDDVEIYYDMNKMANISMPEILSIFVAKDSGAIKTLKIRPYKDEELKNKQEFLAFVVARASASQNVTVISKSFKMPFVIPGVRAIPTMEKLYKGTEPYFFTYNQQALSKSDPQPQKKAAPESKSEPAPVVQPEKKVVAIKREKSPEIPDSKLAEEIVKCINRNGINQTLFAELCEVNKCTVSQFIRGVAGASKASKNKFRKTIRELNEMAPAAKAQ